MKVKDIIQELKKYNFDLETNVIGFKKGDILNVKIKQTKPESVSGSGKSDKETSKAD